MVTSSNAGFVPTKYIQLTTRDGRSRKSSQLEVKLTTVTATRCHTGAINTDVIFVYSKRSSHCKTLSNINKYCLRCLQQNVSVYVSCMMRMFVTRSPHRNRKEKLRSQPERKWCHSLWSLVYLTFKKLELGCVWHLCLKNKQSSITKSFFCPNIFGIFHSALRFHVYIRLPKDGNRASEHSRCCCLNSLRASLKSRTLKPLAINAQFL